MYNFRELPKYNFSSNVYAVMAATLIIAVLPLPYAYYLFLRIFICGACGILAYYNFRSVGGDRAIWSWVFLFAAILYNPLIIIALSEGFWILINLALGITFALLSRQLKS